MMHDALRSRLMRHIEALPEAQVYQALDYIEFLASKYNRAAVRPATAVQRFTDRLEDRMRVQGLAFDTIKGAMGVVGSAGKVVDGITEAGRSVLREVEQVLTPPAEGAAPEPPRLAPPAPQDEDSRRAP
jgi:hypothetical protein